MNLFAATTLFANVYVTVIIHQYTEFNRQQSAFYAVHFSFQHAHLMASTDTVEGRVQYSQMRDSSWQTTVSLAILAGPLACLCFVAVGRFTLE